MDSQKSTHSSESGQAKPARRARGHARVATLLEAAGAEFAEKGYEATTMTAIAARSGSSIGSLYQFFPTKEQIGLALLEQYVAKLQEAFELLRIDAPSLDLSLLAARLTATFVTFRKSHPAFVALVDAHDLALPGSLNIRESLRAGIASVLTALAPRLPAEEAAVRAAVIQHLMKAAVALSADASVVDQERATTELQGLVQYYLGESIAAGEQNQGKSKSPRSATA